MWFPSLSIYQIGIRAKEEPAEAEGHKQDMDTLAVPSNTIKLVEEIVKENSNCVQHSVHVHDAERNTIIISKRS